MLWEQVSRVGVDVKDESPWDGVGVGWLSSRCDGGKQVRPRLPADRSLAAHKRGAPR